MSMDANAISLKFVERFCISQRFHLDAKIIDTINPPETIFRGAPLFRRGDYQKLSLKMVAHL